MSRLARSALWERGADKEGIIIAKSRYQGQLQEHRKFSESMGLIPQMERVYIDGLGRVAPNERFKKLYAANEITGKIVPINKNATFNVEIPGYDNKINKAISKACRDVVYSAGETGQEELRLINLDSGEMVFKETGGMGFVGGQEYKNFIQSKGGRYAFIHNHPDGDGLSEQDVKSLLMNEKIEIMIGAGNNGKVYAGVSGKSHNLNFYKEYTIMKKEVVNEQKKASEMYKNGEIIYPEYSRIIEREVCKKIIQKYGNLYEMET